MSAVSAGSRRAGSRAGQRGADRGLLWLLLGTLELLQIKQRQMLLRSSPPRLPRAV